MNANEIAFGIEIETTLPMGDDTAIGSYHHGLQVSWLPEGWKAERDGSIRTMVPNRKGCEFVSPKLRGVEGLAQAVAAVNTIAARGGKVNHTCGLHVSVEFNGDAAALARLISLVGNHERAMFATTGTKRREQGIYTKKIKDYGNCGLAKACCERDRFHALNLTHIAAGKNRIEFRIFAGTLNVEKIAGAIMMCVGLVELALNSSRATPWNYNHKEGTKGLVGRYNVGDGETEVLRLFYRLGWTKGWYKGDRKDACYGNLQGAGVPSLRAIKDKCIEMARKYDRV